MKALTHSDIVPGAKVIQADHPEYGEWCIVRENPPGTWEVRKSYPNKGLIAVCETELQRFWHKVS
jgi:hypothetical protein